MPSPPALPLRSERLLLRAYRDDDIEATYAYYGDAEVSHYLLTDTFTHDDAAHAVAARVQRTQPSQAGDKLALVVEHDRRLIGDVARSSTWPSATTACTAWPLNSMRTIPPQPECAHAWA